MTVPNVDNTTLNNLTDNLDTGDVADPALRSLSFQYIYAELQVLVNELNNIPTANLQDLAITAAKIANLAVTTGKIADLGVTTAKINDAAVTLAKMAANSVGTSQLVNLSVTNDKVADSTLTAAKFVAGALSNETQNALNIVALQAETEQLNADVEVITNTYSKLEYPTAFDIPTEFKVDLYKYGEGYNVKFDIRSKKIKNDGVTYYVSPTGDDSDSGLEIGLPLKKIDTAIAKTDVETIILLEGDYYLTDNFTTQLIINKSINLIGRGKVRIINGEKATWTAHATYADVYQVEPAPANTSKVISLDTYDENGDLLALTKKTSLSTEVSVTPFSYAIGTNLYIHLLETPTDENIAVLSSADIPVLITDSVGSTQVKVYMENIEIYGAESAIETITQSGQTDKNYLYATNCKFMHSDDSNGLSALGGNYFLVDCVAAYNYRDGFNYHAEDTVEIPNAIEIGCIGRNNGLEVSGTANNGSTSHEGSKIIRVNGEYYGNQGGNVADIDGNTQSLNINCKAFNSTISSTTRAGNFDCLTSAEMWVIDCLSYHSVYDLICDGGEMHTKNNENLVGDNNILNGGTITEI